MGSLLKLLLECLSIGTGGLIFKKKLEICKEKDQSVNSALVHHFILKGMQVEAKKSQVWFSPGFWF